MTGKGGEDAEEVVFQWIEEDEVRDSLGLEGWDYFQVAELTAEVTIKQRTSKNLIKDSEPVKSNMRVAEATLIKNTKAPAFTTRPKARAANVTAFDAISPPG